MKIRPGTASARNPADIRHGEARDEQRRDHDADASADHVERDGRHAALCAAAPGERRADRMKQADAQSAEQRAPPPVRRDSRRTRAGRPRPPRHRRRRSPSGARPGDLRPSRPPAESSSRNSSAAPRTRRWRSASIRSARGNTAREDSRTPRKSPRTDGPASAGSSARRGGRKASYFDDPCPAMPAKSSVRHPGQSRYGGYFPAATQTLQAQLPDSSPPYQPGQENKAGEKDENAATCKDLNPHRRRCPVHVKKQDASNLTLRQGEGAPKPKSVAVLPVSRHCSSR